MYKIELLWRNKAVLQKGLSKSISIMK